MHCTLSFDGEAPGNDGERTSHVKVIQVQRYPRDIDAKCNVQTKLGGPELSSGAWAVKDRKVPARTKRGPVVGPGGTRYMLAVPLTLRASEVPDTPMPIPIEVLPIEVPPELLPRRSGVADPDESAAMAEHIRRFIFIILLGEI